MPSGNLKNIKGGKKDGKIFKTRKKTNIKNGEWSD